MPAPPAQVCPLRGTQQLSFGNTDRFNSVNGTKYAIIQEQGLEEASLSLTVS